uniref:F-box domain-containing protein n=1 Tax=Solanum tuberosum TaxID=4113 RepID=A4UV30_SOLTU|nr:F-box domain-containing protein [Solanum tuberosum]
MFSFLSFWDWIYQTLLFKFLLSWYRFIFTTPISTTTEIIIPNEILTDILLRLPTESLLRFTSVSKSWNQQISSPHFVNTHLKIEANDKKFRNHGIIFENLQFCHLPPLFNKRQVTDEELIQMDPPKLSFFVGSVNGLICLCNHELETYIWNPTIRKLKKIHDSPLRSSSNTKLGFGYDESRDDYKVVFINYSSLCYYDSMCNVSNPKIVVYIYSLRTDSWTTVHDHLQGNFLTNTLGKYINGKINWISCKRLGIHKIISFDIADETWRTLELPIFRQDNCNYQLGVIFKNCGFWTKLFTIKYHPNLSLFMDSILLDAFSIQFHESNNGDFLLLFDPLIMIFDGSTRRRKHSVYVEESVDDGGCDAIEIYVESITHWKFERDPVSLLLCLFGIETVNRLVEDGGMRRGFDIVPERRVMVTFYLLFTNDTTIG